MRNAYVASIADRIEADAEMARITVHRHAIEHGVKHASSICGTGTRFCTELASPTGFEPVTPRLGICGFVLYGVSTAFL
jgi:hypothetical protein